MSNKKFPMWKSVYINQILTIPRRLCTIVTNRFTDQVIGKTFQSEENIDTQSMYNINNELRQAERTQDVKE